MATKREELLALLDTLQRDWAEYSYEDLVEWLVDRHETFPGCLSRAHPDEPLFILRAQDYFAPSLVREWANGAELAGAPGAKVVEALVLADAMDAWQAVHGAKVPD